jgi:hypothetical protein
MHLEPRFPITEKKQLDDDDDNLYHLGRFNNNIKQHRRCRDIHCKISYIKISAKCYQDNS